MSKRVYARRLPPKELIVEDEIRETVQAADVATPVQKFKTLAEQIAKSTIFHRNWYVPELRERFKFLDRMKRVDLVFPYAKLKDGQPPVMLCVDEPKTPIDVEICAKKAKVMKELGYFYVYLERDTTLFDALENLGAV